MMLMCSRHILFLNDVTEAVTTHFIVFGFYGGTFLFIKIAAF